MRLINVNNMKLEEFYDTQVPSYAILSHRWGIEQLTFQDINQPGWQRKAGHMKVFYTCQQAEADGLEYVWIDTCCIDKSSSAELSKAINPMYAWYSRAQQCYAFLDDVSPFSLKVEAQFTVRVGVDFLGRSNPDDQYHDFRASKWFTRGWTLQELVAPSTVKFFGIGWTYLGDREILSTPISQITTIPERILYLQGTKFVRGYSVA